MTTIVQILTLPLLRLIDWTHPFAFVGLVELLREAGGAEGRLLDVQWVTPHLETLGAVEVLRAEYRVALSRALDLSCPWP